MYKVYLDNIEILDLPKGIDNFEIQIVREDGFNSSEQILREKTETEFTFYGDGYVYISNLFKNGACSIIDVRIDDVCDDSRYTLFTGKLHVSDIECDIKRKLIKSQIRDSSFTGLVKDFTKTEIPLYYTKTKNCLTLDSVGKRFLMFPSSGRREILGFDVLDVLNYQIKYSSDNKLYVVSNYLTANKYMITNGYNLHNLSGSLDQKYPNLSFQTLFSELRKKFRLFIVVEYDGLNNPYLRVEPESYSFNTLNILTIPEIQNETIEQVDKTRLYNSIKVGSKKTLITTDVDFYNETNPLLNFNEATFTTCGECTVNSDSEQNELNLVSDFIIDSNIIKEAYSTPFGDTYDYDTEIFLINYKIDLSEPLPVLTLTTCNGYADTFNCALINESVVNNWLGFSPQCLVLSRHSSDYFKIENLGYVAVVHGGSFRDEGLDILEFSNISSDNNNTIKKAISTSVTTPRLLPYPITPHTTTGLGTFNYYECSKSGTYNFISEIINIAQSSSPSYSGNPMTYITHINHYSDNTFSTIINQYTKIVTTPEFSDIVSLSNETGNIAVSVGECIVVDFEFGYDSGSYYFIPANIDFTAERINFYQKEDLSKCEEFENEPQDSKYRLIKFQKELCLNEFQNIKNNKIGNINVNGKIFYIKNLTYRKNKLSDFELIGNQSLL